MNHLIEIQQREYLLRCIQHSSDNNMELLVMAVILFLYFAGKLQENNRD